MLYRYTITPCSPLRTQPMSDTFFGHFCWAVLYQHGEEYLTDFLNLYSNKKPAPVLFSSAFLSGYLPRPDLPPPDGNILNEFVIKHFGAQKKNIFEGLLKIKDWNIRRFISLEQWIQLKDNYSDIKLYEDIANNQQNGGENLSPLEIEVSASNIINRTAGSVSEEGGNGLFHKKKFWYHKGIRLDLYVEINLSEMVEPVNRFLTEYLPQNGFGADKSIGMGSLSIIRDDTFDPNIFSVKEPDCRLSLSLASFSGMENRKAYYRLKTKFGKLGGNFAYSGSDRGNPKPFKKPVLMYEPGAVFFCAESLNDNALLENVHSDSRIRHCGIPVTLPLKTLRVL